MLFFGSSFNPETDLLDLTGKVVFISGANSSLMVGHLRFGHTSSTGIGFYTAKHLARKGAKVYVGARTEAKGQDAIERLHKEGIGSGEVVYHECDVSTPQQTKTVALEFMKREERLDILDKPVSQSTDDYEGALVQDDITRMMMVNYISVFVLTNTLLPLLEKTAKEPNADVRIIAISSEGHTMGKAADPGIRFDSLDALKKTYDEQSIPYLHRYWVSKLALTLFSNSLQRNISPNIVCISLHPGLVHTSIANHLRFARLLNFLLWIFAKTPENGCYTTLFAAASPKVKAEPEKYKARYLVPDGVIQAPNPNALKLELQDELWETTERYLVDIGINQ
ncbi:hypothetical protein BJ165DRAFT_1397449 [Panaeolus papilionaceus]|nr:hypothetical protein BJ165DRAFT_1397449 [Panaeolus papilionaceus]